MSDFIEKAKTRIEELESEADELRSQLDDIEGQIEEIECEIKAYNEQIRFPENTPVIVNDCEGMEVCRGVLLSCTFDGLDEATALVDEEYIHGRFLEKRFLFMNGETCLVEPLKGDEAEAMLARYKGGV